MKKNENKFFILPSGSVGEKHQSKINKITNYLKSLVITLFNVLKELKTEKCETCGKVKDL